MIDFFSLSVFSCQNEIQTLIQKLTKNTNNDEFVVLKIVKSGSMLKWLIKGCLTSGLYCLNFWNLRHQVHFQINCGFKISWEFPFILKYLIVLYIIS